MSKTVQEIFQDKWVDIYGNKGIITDIRFRPEFTDMRVDATLTVPTPGPTLYDEIKLLGIPTRDIRILDKNMKQSLLTDGPIPDRKCNMTAVKAVEEEKEKPKSKITVTKERIDHLMNTATFNVQTVFDKCTIVTAQLENGYILTESSACVDLANYDQKYGEQICKDKIRGKLWELEGYALQKAVHKMLKEAEV